MTTFQNQTPKDAQGARNLVKIANLLREACARRTPSSRHHPRRPLRQSLSALVLITVNLLIAEAFRPLPESLPTPLSAFFIESVWAGDELGIEALLAESTSSTAKPTATEGGDAGEAPSKAELVRAGSSKRTTTDASSTKKDSFAEDEARLKRLEEELIRTIGGSESEPAASDDSRRGSRSGGRSVRIDRVTLSEGARAEPPKQENQPPLEIQGEAKPSSPAAKPANGSEDAGVALLKALEQHPVLVGSDRTRGSDRGRSTRRSRDNDTSARGSEELRSKELDLRDLKPDQLQHRLAIAESQVEILTREIDQLKRRLRTAEQRAQRYDPPVFLGDQGQRRSARDSARMSDSAAALSASFESDLDRWTVDQATKRPPPTPAVSPEVGQRRRRNSEFASVAAQSAQLRLGPHRTESILVPVPANTRVKVEYRLGGWYRVVTSEGTRGWLPSSEVVFTAGISEESTVRILGVKAQG
jgi:hypothetical protein